MNWTLARLYLGKWRRYSRSPHVQGKRGAYVDRWAELLNQRDQAEHGAPLPPNEPPSEMRVLQVCVGEVLCPTDPEAYLTVELLGRIHGFTHWRYLESRAMAQPGHWEKGSGRVHSETAAFVRFLAGVLA